MLENTSYKRRAVWEINLGNAAYSTHSLAEVIYVALLPRLSRCNISVP